MTEVEPDNMLQVVHLPADIMCTSHGDCPHMSGSYGSCRMIRASPVTLSGYGGGLMSSFESCDTGDQSGRTQSCPSRWGPTVTHHPSSSAAATIAAVASRH